MPGPTLKRDDRGQTSNQALLVVTLVVALTVGAIVAAFVMPIGVDAIAGDKSTTLTFESNSTTKTVAGGLNATLDSADGSTATFTLQTDDASATTSALSEGGNETVTLEGYDVNVTADTVNNGNATATFDYPTQVGYSDGAQALWGILDVILVLAVFMIFIAIALGSSDRV